jgi:hypothetical protein
VKNINMNDGVRIKLTTLGRQKLNREVGGYLKSKQLWPTGDDGFTTMHLWELCHYLVPGMGNVMLLVCETNVEVLR